MGRIRESRFHRTEPPARADKQRPAPSRIEPLKEEDLVEISDLTDLPRVWG